MKPIRLVCLLAAAALTPAAWKADPPPFHMRGDHAVGMQCRNIAIQVPRTK